MPPEAVRCQYVEVLATEWQGVLNRCKNSEIPLIFSPVVLTNTLGIQRARDIRTWLSRRMKLWERGLHVGLVGDAYADGGDREDRDSSK